MTFKASVADSFGPLVRDLATSTGLARRQIERTGLTTLALNVVTRRHTAELNPLLRSAEKRRYVVAPRLYQQSSGSTVRQSLRAIHDSLQESILRSDQETGPKVLQLSELEATLLKERFPALLVERDVQYRLARSPLLPEVEPILVPASKGRDITVQVQDEHGGVPAQVYLIVDVAARAGYNGTTNGDGTLHLSLRRADRHFQKIIVVPKGAFWSKVWKGLDVEPTLHLKVNPLQVGGFDWGHLATQADACEEFAGEGVKVAVIDSGIARHPGLRVLSGWNFISAEPEDQWQDQDGHGTHCAGVIAALVREASVRGYAPKVGLMALRVFGGHDGGGYGYDIGQAIERAVEEGCDIISMSFATSEASSYLRSKIEKATDAGVLCVAAVGNEGGAVAYPAKFPNVIGVSAIGKEGTFPLDSIHAEAQGTIHSVDGQYFFAAFSNRGDEVDLCAPGVAITSTLPPDTFGAWDGTSMACPHVAGIAALTLDASPPIRVAPRESGRMGALLDRLLGLATDLGMGQAYQGSGLPQLGRLAATTAD